MLNYTFLGKRKERQVKSLKYLKSLNFIFCSNFRKTAAVQCYLSQLTVSIEHTQLLENNLLQYIRKVKNKH